MSTQRIMLLSAALLFLAGGAAQAQTTVWVDGNNGSDLTGDGSQGNPVASITFAFTDVATDGDTIRVLPGTYNECVDATSFAVGETRVVDIVADDPDPAMTTIDGTGQCAHPFSTVNIGGTGASFSGFTVTGGVASGIFGRGSVTITNNVVTGNSSTFGGGIYVYTGACYYGDATVDVSGNTVTGNTAVYDQALGFGGDGGGIYVLSVGIDDPSCVNGDANVTVANNTISNNSVQGNLAGANTPFGAGLVVFSNTSLVRNSDVIVTQNTITGNTHLAGSSGYGGGAWVQTYGYGYETIDFNNNTVAANTSTGDGGGVSAWILTLGNAHHQVTVDNNSVTGNTSQGNGGGLDLFMFADDLLPTQSLELAATNNTVTGNQSQGNLGGAGGILGSLFANRSNGAVTPMDFTISGNRVTGNDSTFMGGGMGLIVSADADPALDGVTVRTTAQIDASGNLIANNSAQGSGTAAGGGVLAFLQAFGEAFSTVNLVQNTVADNSTDADASGVHIEQLSLFDSLFNFEGINDVTLNSNIIAGNDGEAVGGPAPAAPGLITDGTGFFNLSVDVVYNSFFGNLGGSNSGDNWVNFGTGNIENVDPLIAGPLYVPDSCSPTIDAADPALPFATEPGANGSRANMGHTGSSASAVATLPDLNGDGTVDGIDIVRFSTAFNSNAGEPRYLAVPEADIDGSGSVNGTDLAFLAPLFGNSCP